MTTMKKTNAAVSIAVVDDDSIVRNGLSELLNSSSDLQCVGTFHDVSEAMTGMRECTPDILLLDVNLPGASGLEAILPMRTRFPQMKIIMHSNYDEEEKIVRAMRDGASGYVLKNQGTSVLHEAILKVRDGGSVWPSGYDESSFADRENKRTGLVNSLKEKTRVFFRK
ncbi:response regulator transcription factor [bacterium]|nr:response regulator transcription factor [bacterium]